mmetsp:Transcript_45542/g.106993  ORF Transcript_45542/g.106993 Transcript_45542/m.106993 type:complete len:207 (-) Transcript_45542:364-984(-)
MAQLLRSIATTLPGTNLELMSVYTTSPDSVSVNLDPARDEPMAHVTPDPSHSWERRAFRCSGLHVRSTTTAPTCMQPRHAPGGPWTWTLNTVCRSCIGRFPSAYAHSSPANPALRTLFLQFSTTLTPPTVSLSSNEWISAWSNVSALARSCTQPGRGVWARRHVRNCRRRSRLSSGLRSSSLFATRQPQGDEPRCARGLSPFASAR